MILFVQPIPGKSIEDSVLGWMKVYNYKGVKAPIKKVAHLFNALSFDCSGNTTNKPFFVQKFAAGNGLLPSLFSSHHFI